MTETPVSGERPLWQSGFQPRRFLSNRHLQTLAGNYLRREHDLPPPEARLFKVDAQSLVRCECHWQLDGSNEPRRERMTVILVHGLEGSSSSHYILGNGTKMWAAGMNVIRMNMRNCGGTERLTPTLYHSGFSADVAAIVNTLIAEGCKAIACVGYSMGGNLVLKYAGEIGPDAPKQLKAVIGVSPAADLSASSTALDQGINRLYQWHFLERMKARFGRKAELFPDLYSTRDLPRMRSIRDYDENIVARYCGFAGAEDYYYRAAAARVVDRIAVPTLVLHAQDDPFIILTPETRATLLANPHVELVEPQYGGHCAFLASRAEYVDSYWAERVVRAFLMAHSNHAATMSEDAASVVAGN
jgi:hypothetical protein